MLFIKYDINQREHIFLYILLNYKSLPDQLFYEKVIQHHPAGTFREFSAINSLHKTAYLTKEGSSAPITLLNRNVQDTRNENSLERAPLIKDITIPFI